MWDACIEAEPPVNRPGMESGWGMLKAWQRVVAVKKGDVVRSHTF